MGVELAAASITASSCEEIAARIAHNLDCLETTMRDVPERHRSLRAVFEHSWNLLTEEEQSVFPKLAVFRGGFETRAARTVAGASERVLSALVSQSLVRKTSDVRYEMHELLRQYATERLDENPQLKDETLDHHCEYYAEFLSQRAEHLRGKRQKETLAEINTEIENVRATWQHAVERQKDAALEKSIISLNRFYETHSWFQEGLMIFGRAATSLEAAFGPVEHITGRKAVVLGMILAQQGWYSHRLGFSEEARTLLQKSLQILRRQGIRRELAIVINESGVVTYRAGDFSKAKQLYEESIVVCRKLDERRELAVALSNLGNVCRALGEYEQAREYLQESVDVFRERGDQYSMSVALNNLGEVLRALGGHLEARQHYQEGLAIRRELGDRMGIAVSLTNLGGVAWFLGDYEQAKLLLQESLDIFVELENRRECAYPIGCLGLVARDLREYDEALAYFQESIKICMETQNIPKALDIVKDVASVWAKKGKRKQALELVVLVLHHAATNKETRRNAKEILAELEAELLPSEVANTQKRGQKLKLEAVVKRILG